MKRSKPIAAGCLAALVACSSPGCSPSAPETAQVEGKTPAEYREEMEKKSGQFVDGKAPKVRKGRSGRG